MATLRERSKHNRRIKILEAAQNTIAEEGLGALNTRSLASLAGVTRPTLYNLIGSKDDIVKQILLQAAERTVEIIRSFEFDNLVNSTHLFGDTLADLLSSEPTLYRSALSAGSFSNELFCDSEWSKHRGSIASMTIGVLNDLCQQHIEQDNLRGNINSESLSSTLYSIFVSNLRDWANETISTLEFRRRLKRAFFLILAADASRCVRDRLLS